MFLFHDTFFFIFYLWFYLFFLSWFFFFVCVCGVCLNFFRRFLFGLFYNIFEHGASVAYFGALPNASTNAETTTGNEAETGAETEAGAGTGTGTGAGI
jgi:hypothetical protein